MRWRVNFPVQCLEKPDLVAGFREPSSADIQLLLGLWDQIVAVAQLVLRAQVVGALPLTETLAFNARTSARSNGLRFAGVAERRS